mmetsp:Transcript_30259/g.35708  ORF Transcript_30259/g.35708 Transcript_30259/m.35708 type:complete len:671 (-) Transcript_30259:81-2093(-)
MEAWKRKKKKAEAQAHAAAQRAAAAAIPKEVEEPISSEDEELPPALTFKGKLITLAPGKLVTLLPSETSRPVEDRESIELNFIKMNKKKKRKGKARREIENQKETIDEEELKSFVWDDLKPGNRPDTLVVRGIPYKWFDLTPDSLQRQKVVPGSSPLRRLLETFATVYDLDVRAFDPDAKAKGQYVLMAGKKWLNRAMDHRSERAAGVDPNSTQQEQEQQTENPIKETPLELTITHNNEEDIHVEEDDASALNLFENDDDNQSPTSKKNSPVINSQEVKKNSIGVKSSPEIVRQASPKRKEQEPHHEPLSFQETQAVSEPTKTSDGDVIRNIDHGSTFEALVQYRTYEGFQASMAGLGAKEMHYKDPLGFTGVARLEVVCDYSGYFTKEALKLRAAGAKREIQIQARKQAAKDRAELRLGEGARETAQAARVAAVGLELRVSDFEHEPVEQAWIAKDAKLASLVQAAIDAMVDVRRNISKFEGDPVETLVDLAGLATARADCRDSIAEADHRLKVAEKFFLKLRANAKLELPTLEDALKSLGCNIFLELISQQWSLLEIGSSPEGRTLFAPDDAAFLGSLDNWEPECWGLHVLEVPLLVSDMINNPGGRVQPLDRHPKHALRVRSAMDGRPSICCLGDSRPPRIALVMKGDVKISGGIIVHVLDRILYPP